MVDLRVRSLTSEEVTYVWPLARTTSRNHGLLGWLCLVRGIFRRGGGVIGVAAEDGIFHGIATYEPVNSVRAGKVLRVHTMACLELSKRRPVRHALLLELDRLAALLDCKVVTFTTQSRTYGSHKAD